MDPDQCLEDALAAAERIIDSPEEELSNDEMHDLAIDLAHSVFAIHDWIRGGGFLPKEWRVKP